MTVFVKVYRFVKTPTFADVKQIQQINFTNIARLEKITHDIL
ncbi:hypothetical protein L248_2552 [Schleiferilactobacillus shenzhenensis LY-73]|uniref:Uncharacterized protein n=1 Tax=Schleiferilactobacillus shenzhenensis LY-73 TaxID=1231336 RepID=U4TMP0_9LACO|nr:hypothetical protein L248_2552 [Schleiferilactobacillus shenzhenensis LY-73]